MNKPENYQQFLDAKSRIGSSCGFNPEFMPPSLIDFQASLVEWAMRKGRPALFCDCGMGKTLMQLVWAENVVRKTNRPVLILTPLAVASQTVKEAEKFGMEAERSQDGSRKGRARIVVANYERLHYFDQSNFSAVVCDESSILKNFAGTTRTAVTEFVRKVPYRLLCTATASPNDYIELGTSSEALGELGHIDMLSKFFKKDSDSVGVRRFGEAQKWRLKGHAERQFWRWVCSWARAARRPSDLGFEDRGFKLPPLSEKEHIVAMSIKRDGMLFDLPAVGLHEQREERRRTIKDRCKKAAELVSGTGRPAIIWCHLNAEGTLLKELVSDALEVSGSDSDEAKEEKFESFISGETRVLVTKPKIGGFGLNLQHCAHVVCFPSHSFEQYYQAVRRCWRFGQKKPVMVDVVATEGDGAVLKNMKRKAAQADKMFANLVAQMNDAMTIERLKVGVENVRRPKWLRKIK